MSSPAATGNAAAAAGSAGSSGNTGNTRRRWSRPQTTAATPLTKIAELEKAIFDYGPNVKPDHFQRSRLAIENYIQINYKDPRDIVDAIRNLAKPASLTPPPRPVRSNTVTATSNDDFLCDFEDWKEKNAAYNARKAKYASHEANAWGLIYRQCTAALRSQLEGSTGFQKCKSDFDVVSLLIMIEGLCSKMGDVEQEYFAVATAFRTLCMYYQPDGMSNDDYYDRFKGMVRVIRKFSGDQAIGFLPVQAEKELAAMATTQSFSVTSATDEQKEEAIEVACNKFLACIMLAGANQKKYASLKASLSNSFAMKVDNYPTDIDAVLRLLNT